MEGENVSEKNSKISPNNEKPNESTPDISKESCDSENASEKNTTLSSSNEKLVETSLPDVMKESGKEPSEKMTSVTISKDSSDLDKDSSVLNKNGSKDNSMLDRDGSLQDKDSSKQAGDSSAFGKDDGKDDLSNKIDEVNVASERVDSDPKVSEGKVLKSEVEKETNANTNNEILSEEKVLEPIFDGTEVPETVTNGSESARSLDPNQELEGAAWPDKAVAITNFVKEKSVGAVTTLIRKLSGKRNELGQEIPEAENKTVPDPTENNETPNKSKVERSAWNPLSYIKISRDDAEKKSEPEAETVEVPEQLQPIAMKGRIILYTRLGCKDCKDARLFLHQRRLKYVEINIDVFPSRKPELEKFCGSCAVPKIFFNNVLIGGLDKIKGLDDSGKLNEKIVSLINEEPSNEAPLPPHSEEGDLSRNWGVDELAVIVRKMRQTIVVKDRFYRMRRFTKCFIGSEAVDFLSKDQDLEKQKAIELGRKLASKLFFQHVLEENLFEDGSHLYRFLDDDPIVSSQCHNIPRGIIDESPKPIVEIASRLRFLSYAIFEAYTSEDGKHVDYGSINGSEEFARYLRTVEELQRVELEHMTRDEKLALFINLYNMMAIHAVLVLGYPVGALERRKLFGDFKYVVGGCTYSLSAIQNGILRGNQRPPYNLMKPFGARDNRFMVALPCAEPLIHFALAFGSRSGPCVRCYSPANIDRELTEAATNFLSSGGLIIDLKAGSALASKILKWYSVDFGKNEVEVLKYLAKYMESADSDALLDFLKENQLKVTYQPYDWGCNY